MRSLFGLPLVFAGLTLSASAAEQPPKYVTDALAWVERPPFEMALDKILRPADVLSMAGIKPGIKVVDLMPGSGYYTRIMSHIVGEKGKVYAFIAQSNGIGEMGKSAARGVKEFGAGAALTPVERVTGRAYQRNVAKNTDVFWEWVDGKQYPNDLRFGNFALPEQIDVIVTQFSYHIFKGTDFSNTDMNRFLGAIYRGMNNNGVVIVIDNMAATGMSLDRAVALNRMDPAVVRAEMTKAGFVLEGERNLSAPAGDDRAHMAEDVFLTRTPKPADLFVLKFRKPKDAPDTNLRPKDPLKLMQGFFGNSIVIGNGVSTGDHSVHLIHEDGTYQEIRGTGFDSGLWFFNADGWNCRYRPGRSFADCATTPHEYDNRKVGDRWEAPHGHYELHKGYDYSIVLDNNFPPPRLDEAPAPAR
jgi:predicted methyltransferase